MRIWKAVLSFLAFSSLVERMELGSLPQDHDILEEDYDENYEPTEEGEFKCSCDAEVLFTTPAALQNQLLLFCIPAASEVLAYCSILGLNPETESDLMYIAKEGIRAPVPAQWKPM